MESLVLLPLFVVLGAAGYYFARDQRIKRRLRGAKAWSLAELPENTVGRVIGRVRALDGSLSAPLTGRACVYYDVAAVTTGSGGLKTVFSGQKGIPFVVEDDTGRAIVDPAGAKVVLVADHWSGEVTTPLTPQEAVLLERHGYKRGGALDPKPFGFSESVIEIGETIAVLGSGVREPDRDRPPASAYRAPLPTLLRLTSSARYPLLISDEPKTTVVDGSGHDGA